MKKFMVLAIATLALTLNANAQEAKEKKHSLEIGFNPFSNDFKTFKIDDLKYRFFLNEKNALRVKLGFGTESDKTSESSTIYTPQFEVTPNTTDPTTTGEKTVNTDVKTKSSNFNLNLGYERHRELSKRVDIYGGIEVGFGLSRAKKTTDETVESYSKTMTSNNYGYTTYATQSETTENSSSKTTDKGDGFNKFCMNLFTGVEVTVWKDLYLGAEIGLGFNHCKFMNPSTDFTSNQEIVSKSTSTESTNGKVTNTTYYNTSVNNSVKDGVTSYHKTINNNGTITTEESTSKDRTEHSYSHKSNNFKLYAEPCLTIGWKF